MKILQVIKSDSAGGAAVACMRLTKALNKSGLQVSVLCDVKKSDQDYVSETSSSFIKRRLESLRFLAERLFFVCHEKNKSIRFAFSPANTGISITGNAFFKQSDIIHLHWINQGFLSIKSLEKIIGTGKPVVWTLHDMWAFTGGCHYTGDCKNFLGECGNCPFLKNPSADDLSHKLWKKKKIFFEKAAGKITFVTCSPWLKEQAMLSSLLNNCRIESIPNPINTAVFKKINKDDCRSALGLKKAEKYLLFGAMNVHDPRKGFAFFREALLQLKSKGIGNITVLIFGKSKKPVDLPYPVISFSFIDSTEKLIAMFNAADVYVHSSLEDNLPNIIMESMACGTPVAAFDTGGIPSMIENNINGRLARCESASGLADAIMDCLSEENNTRYSVQAVKKVEKCYAEVNVASQYNRLYNELTSK